MDISCRKPYSKKLVTSKKSTVPERSNQKHKIDEVSSQLMSREQVKALLQQLIEEERAKPWTVKRYAILEKFVEAVDQGGEGWVGISLLLTAYAHGAEAGKGVLSVAISKLRRELKTLGLDIQRQTTYRVVPRGTPKPPRER